MQQVTEYGETVVVEIDSLLVEDNKVSDGDAIKIGKGRILLLLIIKELEITNKFF